MAWEQQGKRQYYYRSRRVGRRVVRDYYGGGVEAELVAALDQQRQQRRQAERQNLVQARETWQSAGQPLFELIAVTNLLVHAALLAGGYRQHHQSEWRKRRVHDNGANGTSDNTDDCTLAGAGREGSARGLHGPA